MLTKAQTCGGKIVVHMVPKFEFFLFLIGSSSVKWGGVTLDNYCRNKPEVMKVLVVTVCPAQQITHTENHLITGQTFHC